MNNFLATVREALSRVRKVWIISAVVILGLVVGLTSFASGAIGRAIAGISGNNPVASVNVQAAVTPTMLPMPGMEESPTAMPLMAGMADMETPTAMPDGHTMAPETSAYNQQFSESDLDALAYQMQNMMQSLDGLMTQLDEKDPHAAMAPTAAPVVNVDMPAIMAEMQSINQDMGPLMVRIQADLEGNPSAEELASVRAQVAQINTRIGNLLKQLQAARGHSMAGMPAPQAAGTPAASMPGTGSQPGMSHADPSQARIMEMDQMLKEMDEMLHQMQSGGAAGHTSPMPGMTMPSAGPGMAGHGPAMGDIMQRMDEMMAKIDRMMGMSGMAGQSGGMSNMAGMAGMDPSKKMMDEMMMMMDNMMMMMDNMKGMKGMPDM